MSGYKIHTLPFLTKDGRPVGVISPLGQEVLLPTFSVDGLSLLKPDGAVFSGGGGAVPTTVGSNLWVYGHSYTASPGLACTAGNEFFNELVLARVVRAATSYGVSSGRLINCFFDMLGSSASSKAGSTWDGTRRGLAVLDCTINDAYNPPSSAANVAGTALTALNVKNYTDTLFACLAVLSSSGRVDTSTGTTTGTWSVSTSTTYSGGTVVRTQEPNAYVDVPVTVPAAGYVYLLTYAVAGNSAGDFTVTEGATNYATVLGANTNASAVWSRREGASQIVMPLLIKITATPGAHTFRITKTDAVATNYIYADCFLLPSAAPVPVAMLRDPQVSTTQGALNTPLTMANLALLDAAIPGVLAQFPNVTLVDAGLSIATDISIVDNIHPNDRGMRKEAQALAAWAQQQDMDGQYTTL